MMRYVLNCRFWRLKTPLRLTVSPGERASPTDWSALNSTGIATIPSATFAEGIIALEPYRCSVSRNCPFRTGWLTGLLSARDLSFSQLITLPRPFAWSFGISVFLICRAVTFSPGRRSFVISMIAIFWPSCSARIALMCPW